MSNCSHLEKDGHLGTSWQPLILTNPPIGEPNWSVFTDPWPACCSLHCWVYFQTCQWVCEKVTHMTRVLGSTEMGCEEKRVASQCGDRTDTQIWETEPRNCGPTMVLNQSPNETSVKSL